MGMPQRQAQVYVMRELEGLTRQEVAEKLEISPNTVDNQYTRAKSHMTNAVEKTMFLEDEIGGVLEWIEKMMEKEHPTQDEIGPDGIREYWENYPAVPGGR